MNVSLTSELEKFIKSRISSKTYQTASEVVREALRLMKKLDEEREARLEALKRDIQIGVDQIERGEYIEIKNKADLRRLANDIKRRGRARLAAAKRCAA